jgi:hypothetical protein
MSCPDCKCCLGACCCGSQECENTTCEECLARSEYHTWAGIRTKCLGGEEEDAEQGTPCGTEAREEVITDPETGMIVKTVRYPAAPACHECEPPQLLCADEPSWNLYTLTNAGYLGTGESALLSREDFGEWNCLDVENPSQCSEEPCAVETLEHVLLFTPNCGDDPEEEVRITVFCAIIATAWVGGGDITSPEVAQSTREFRVVADCGVLELIPDGDVETVGYEGICSPQNELIDRLLSLNEVSLNPFP